MTPDSNTKRPRFEYIGVSVSQKGPDQFYPFFFWRVFRKRKQDTPQDSRNIRPIKNQRPINAYFETNTENKTPGRTRDNGVSVRPFLIDSFFKIQFREISWGIMMLHLITELLQLSRRQMEHQLDGNEECHQ